MEIITSITNKKIKEYSKLLEKKYREIENKFLVMGEHLVEEAYKTNNLLEVIKTEDCSLFFDVPTTLVTYPVLKKLTNVQNPQNIIGVVKRLEEKEIKEKVLILDGIQDPGNMGTIIRSAHAFGVDSIVVSNTCVDIYNDKVIRASEGMLFKVNILKRDCISFIKEVKEKKYTVYGTKVDGGTPLKKIDKRKEKVAIVMGNEGAGVSKEVLDLCDAYLYIPMISTCESLNVGVATGIILYELF